MLLDELSGRLAGVLRLSIHLSVTTLVNTFFLNEKTILMPSGTTGGQSNNTKRSTVRVKGHGHTQSC